MPWRRAWQLTPVFLPGEPPWTVEPGRLQSIGSQNFGDWITKFWRLEGGFFTTVTWEALTDVISWLN